MQSIIIIGGGMAGLYAARELAKKKYHITLLEARQRLGGRVHTIHDTRFLKPVEGGAEFIHGNLPITIGLLKDAGLKYHPMEGEIWRHRNGDFVQDEDFVEDGGLLAKKLKDLDREMTVAEFLNRHLNGDQYAKLRESVIKFVEGYDAGDHTRASALALKEDWLGGDEDQYRPEGGYAGLLHFLENDCRQQGVEIITETNIRAVSWQPHEVRVESVNGKIFQAAQVIITVPLGVLLAGDIAFSPAIPAKTAAVEQMGFGDVIKVLIQCKHAFWRDESLTNRTGNKFDKMSWIFSDEAVPTWWTQFPERSFMLTGWLAGPRASERRNWDDARLLEEAVDSLAVLFKTTAADLTGFIAHAEVFNWPADPFSKGAYSYATTRTAAAIEELAFPVEHTIFFAGEALAESPHNGTVEGALKDLWSFFEPRSHKGTELHRAPPCLCDSVVQKTLSF